MFLDDQLYNHTINRKIDSVEDMQSLINELYEMTEKYFKPQLRADMTYKEGKQLMDRVFSLWDLFIKKLDKNNWVFADVMPNAHYKKAFMNNEQLKEIYNKGI